MLLKRCRTPITRHGSYEMAEITKKLHYRKGGATVDIKLYNSVSDVGSDYMSLQVDSATVYAHLGSTIETEASELMVRKGGQTFAVLKSNRIDLPSGFIAMFESSSCPDGWTQENAFNGKFLMASGSYGTTVVNDNHTHTYSIGRTYTDYRTATYDVRDYPDFYMPEVTHRHRSYATVTLTSDNANNALPPYIEVIFCRKD
ncbi:MAG: hypothetical protein GY950_04190 [bacterium]|nr:hypothetical protein [bacterium]